MATASTTTSKAPLAQAAEALRCRFTDLAGLYVQPGGSQHRVDSLWWWVKFVYDHSALRPAEGGGSLKRVFALSEGHKSIRAAWGKSKAYLFALAYKYTAHWRACAEREPQPQPQHQEGSTEAIQAAPPVLVKPDPEDQLLAWLDLLLLIAWKHMSTQTAKSRKGWLAFPFVTLKRATVDESDPATAVFSDYEYLGLTTVEEASGWQLEWTDEGEKAFQHWSGREDEIKAMGSLRRRLIDDRAEAALADARKALATAIGGGRARHARQSKATVIDLTAETVVKLSAEVGALREELSKLLAETKKQKKKRLRVKKEKKEKKNKKNKKRKKEEKEKEEGTENEESDDDRSDDDANGDDHADDDEDDEIEDEGDDQSQTTLSRKRKRQEEEKEKINGKKNKKNKKKSNKKEKKRRTDDDDEAGGEAEKKEEEKRTAPEEQDDDNNDEDGDDGEERHKLVRRRKRRARSLFEMRAGSCTQS